MSDAEGMFEEVLAREIADLIKHHVAVATRPLRDEIKELRAQIAERRWVGGYQRAQSYKCHNMCTQDGSMWYAVCDVAPNEQPGKSAVWQLCCRAGRDGKDATRAVA